MLSNFKRNKHQQHLAQLPKISQSVDDVDFFYAPADFRETLLEKIASAKQRICIVALYLEQDDGGKGILNALYEAKRQRPELDVRVLVDWHRAQRGRIGAAASNTNADWYCRMAQENPGVDVPVYGVPINTREALGVLHFKGFIIDDSVLYSGASLNDVYLHQHDKYRYDRYHLIRNRKMSDIMFEWVTQNIMNGRGVNRLDDVNRPKSPEIKNDIRLFRQELRDAAYHFQGDADNDQLSVTPLVGLGKSSLLNKTIFHLMPCAEQKLTICTPYFNLPAILVRNIIQLLREGKKVEIIVGDKTANDFYIPEDEPFKIIGALPYLYEINLRRFLSRLQYYVNTDQLVVRLWKDDDNTYHLKGMWVDDKWMLITGNNLNPRRVWIWKTLFDHDPQLELAPQREELELIHEHTTIVKHYRDLRKYCRLSGEGSKLIRRLRRIRIDRLISASCNHNPVLYGVCFGGHVLRILFVCSLLLLSGCSHMANDSWSGQDKAQHFIASAMLSAAGMICTASGMSRDRSATFGLMFSVGLGASKELWDSRPEGRLELERFYGMSPVQLLAIPSGSWRIH